MVELISEEELPMEVRLKRAEARIEELKNTIHEQQTELLILRSENRKLHGFQ